MKPPSSFACAICGRFSDMRFPGSIQMWPLPPVCSYCESRLGAKAPPAGSFRDRRYAQVISALAVALEVSAKHMEQGHACPRL